jgi:glycosyltransferase involved in cell wall biosynthesis
MTDFISVVIPSFNRAETLKTVLPSLSRQTLSPDRYEILLSDSNSTDGTCTLLEELSIPNLRILRRRNEGRSGARNFGIDEARGDIVMFTDADIIADEHLLEEHLKFHRKFPGDAVVGCEVQVNTIEEYEKASKTPGLRRHLHPSSRKTLPWLYFLTGNASVTRKALLEAGKFDENFTGYGHEDLELGYRLVGMGLVIHYNPAAINYHWHPVGFEERCRKMRLAGRSTVRFYNKHRDPSIKLKLGFNPFSLFWHSILPEGGFLFRTCLRMSGTSAFCSEIILQHHYLSGIKEALKDRR